MYRAIIVEDDLMVCSILEKLMGRFPQVKIEGKFRRGSEALSFLAEKPDGADLIILDYYMPGMTGIDFLAKLRSANTEIQVIMITSADEYSVICAAMCHGICDYILKPFTVGRLEEAINKFDMIMKLKKDTHVWTQDKVDTLLCPHKTYKADQDGTENNGSRADKINPTTLTTVRDYMKKFRGENMPLSVISGGLGLSTVTVRRYLKYMKTLGEVNISLDCKTGGRPSEIFQYVGEKHNEKLKKSL